MEVASVAPTAFVAGLADCQYAPKGAIFPQETRKAIRNNVKDLMNKYEREVYDLMAAVLEAANDNDKEKAAVIRLEMDQSNQQFNRVRALLKTAQEPAQMNATGSNISLRDIPIFRLNGHSVAHQQSRTHSTRHAFLVVPDAAFLPDDPVPWFTRHTHNTETYKKLSGCVEKVNECYHCHRAWIPGHKCPEYQNSAAHKQRKGNVAVNAIRKSRAAIMDSIAHKLELASLGVDLILGFDIMPKMGISITGVATSWNANDYKENMKVEQLIMDDLEPNNSPYGT
ncbi:hypothetical protein CLU79DRAFT_716865 [Phycomyces nitens]|nr:hypothetical protein CLU79DRAFT_716865 [Phycomyces nitens]